MFDTRAAAKAAGEKMYAGALCVHGHSVRWVINRTCVECTKVKSAARPDRNVHRDARSRNTMLALYYEQEFDRAGWRQVGGEADDGA